MRVQARQGQRHIGKSRVLGNGSAWGKAGRSMRAAGTPGGSGRPAWKGCKRSHRAGKAGHQTARLCPLPTLKGKEFKEKASTEEAGKQANPKFAERGQA